MGDAYNFGISSFSEAISSPHPTVPHGSRFTFGESGRAGQSINVVEGMDATRVDLNLLEGSGDGGQSSSSTLAGNQHGDNVVVAIVEGVNNQSIEPIAGPSSQAHGSQIPVAKKSKFSFHKVLSESGRSFDWVI